MNSNKLGRDQAAWKLKSALTKTGPENTGMSWSSQSIVNTKQLESPMLQHPPKCCNTTRKSIMQKSKSRKRKSRKTKTTVLKTTKLRVKIVLLLDKISTEWLKDPHVATPPQQQINHKNLQDNKSNKHNDEKLL